ncbi:MAG: phospholipid/cholesterol/gamma-HCH transport system substrate-binding protein [Solirubrobacteraceae bacterium]|jgi:virulence factor Mce-like protein|nr:phospholipid/cholesterol/gamma-HCH transport system substrate-binding protein [Solirubrobacteraceae bacterium]
MRGRRPPSIASNPVFVGTVTTLVIVIAVLLAYNANQGLPFLPTFELKVDTPNAARLVVGNEVRQGGFRIGQVAAIDPVPGSRSGAQLTLRLDKSATPLPADSTIRIRPRSALGLKFVEVVRGKSSRELPDGATITASSGAVGPELDDFFSVFDDRTRANVDRNLDYFGTALAGRGTAINRTLGSLPALVGNLPPVMRTLSDRNTQLTRLLTETGDFARIVAPLSDTFARGFTGMANTFEAISRDPQALRDTIAATPATLDEGIRSLPDTRPFLSRLAGISDEVRGTARELRRSLPPVNRALAAGTPVLRRTPEFTDKLQGALRALRDLAKSPTTDMTLAGLTATMKTLNPTLRYVGPHVTVCNYFTYFWSFIADHISDEDATGTVQRVQVKMAPLLQPNSMAVIGATRPANGGTADPVTKALSGDPAALHDQIYNAAVDSSGNADCESGQRGYVQRAATGFPSDLNIAVDTRTPGAQGPTFKGRPRVPAGETFSSEPGGIAPAVAP